MGRYLRLLALFFATLLIVVSLSACMEPGEGETSEVTTSVTVSSTTVTTTLPPPAEDPPPVDSGYDDDGFENRPEDDETKRY